jgi:hypothetical protein
LKGRTSGACNLIKASQNKERPDSFEEIRLIIKNKFDGLRFGAHDERFAARLEFAQFTARYDIGCSETN